MKKIKVNSESPVEPDWQRYRTIHPTLKIWILITLYVKCKY